MRNYIKDHGTVAINEPARVLGTIYVPSYNAEHTLFFIIKIDGKYVAINSYDTCNEDESPYVDGLFFEDTEVVIDEEIEIIISRIQYDMAYPAFVRLIEYKLKDIPVDWKKVEKYYSYLSGGRS